jgi:hypothetical protein
VETPKTTHIWRSDGADVNPWKDQNLDPSIGSVMDVSNVNTVLTFVTTIFPAFCLALVVVSLVNFVGCHGLRMAGK